MDPSRLPLRDIHLPDPVSWWPPAPGWWLLLFAISFTVFGFAWLRYRKAGPADAGAQYAKAGIRLLREEYSKHGDRVKTVRDLSVLLRRITVSIFPRTEAAGLTGTAWLEFLDRSVAGEPFSKGPGRALVTAPYQPRPGDIDAETLLLLSEDWVNNVTEQARDGR